MTERKPKEGQTKGTFVVIGMDQSSVDALGCCNNRICYGMTKVTFKRYDPIEDKEDDAGGPTVSNDSATAAPQN